jgi:hypothetical protein
MMFQNGTKKLLKLVAFNTLILVLAASCSKAPSGVRAQVKNQQNTIAPTTTTQATQQAASSGADYVISTITLPQPDDNGGYTVDVELKTPNGQFLPITTKHQVNNGFSQGTYNDSQTGMQVLIQASCNSSNCSKYMVLVTVSRNGQNLYQNFAISYDTDCKFYWIASSANAGAYYSSLSAAENANMNYGPQNDISTCPM